jgi:hypothetical protein
MERLPFVREQNKRYNFVSILALSYVFVIADDCQTVVIS